MQPVNPCKCNHSSCIFGRFCILSFFSRWFAAMKDQGSQILDIPKKVAGCPNQWRNTERKAKRFDTVSWEYSSLVAAINLKIDGYKRLMHISRDSTSSRIWQTHNSICLKKQRNQTHISLKEACRTISKLVRFSGLLLGLSLPYTWLGIVGEWHCSASNEKLEQQPARLKGHRRLLGQLD